MTPTKITLAHAAYQDSTGFIIPPMIHNEVIWQSWLGCGFKPEDIPVVVNYMRREFPKYWQKMVRWPRFITDHPDFAGYLAMARASQRNLPKPPTPRQQALAAVHRQEPEVQGVKRVDEVVRDLTGDYEALRKAAGL